MSKYKVNKGYVFINPKNNEPTPSGTIVELSDDVAKQQIWKLTLLLDGKSEKEGMLNGISEHPQDGPKSDNWGEGKKSSLREEPEDASVGEITATQT